MNDARIYEVASSLESYSLGGNNKREQSKSKGQGIKWECHS